MATTTPRGRAAVCTLPNHLPATRLVLANGASLLTAAGADQVTLSGLVLDGGRRPLPEQRGLVQLENCASLKIVDCEIKDAGGNGIVLVAGTGEITATTITGAADVALHSLDARGLVLARNTINGAGNNAIQVWRSERATTAPSWSTTASRISTTRSGGSADTARRQRVSAPGVIVRGNRTATVRSRR